MSLLFSVIFLAVEAWTRTESNGAQCCYLYGSTPRNGSNCVPEGTQATLTHYILNPHDNFTNLTVKWFKADDMPMYESTPDSEALSSTQSNYQFSSNINPQNTSRSCDIGPLYRDSFFLAINNFTSDNNGYYWCQIFVNSSGFQSSQYALLYAADKSSCMRRSYLNPPHCALFHRSSVPTLMMNLQITQPEAPHKTTMHIAKITPTKSSPLATIYKPSLQHSTTTTDSIHNQRSSSTTLFESPPGTTTTGALSSCTTLFESPPGTTTTGALSSRTTLFQFPPGTTTTGALSSRTTLFKSPPGTTTARSSTTLFESPAGTTTTRPLTYYYYAATTAMAPKSGMEQLAYVAGFICLFILLLTSLVILLLLLYLWKVQKEKHRKSGKPKVTVRKVNADNLPRVETLAWANSVLQDTDIPTEEGTYSVVYDISIDNQPLNPIGKDHEYETVELLNQCDSQTHSQYNKLHQQYNTNILADNDLCPKMYETKAKTLRSNLNLDLYQAKYDVAANSGTGLEQVVQTSNKHNQIVPQSYETVYQATNNERKVESTDCSVNEFFDDEKHSKPQPTVTLWSGKNSFDYSTPQSQNLAALPVKINDESYTQAHTTFSYSTETMNDLISPILHNIADCEFDDPRYDSVSHKSLVVLHSMQTKTSPSMELTSDHDRMDMTSSAMDVHQELLVNYDDAQEHSDPIDFTSVHNEPYREVNGSEGKLIVDDPTYA